MATIIRNRTIRPSSRLETSKSYKIETKTVDSGDTLIVNIDHESKPFYKSFSFDGRDVKGRNSISFRVNDYGTQIDISWSGATPKGFLSPTNKKVIPTQPKEISSPTFYKIRENEIVGLVPVIDENSKVLILGTMPGVESLKQQAYYSHSRNLFWQLIGEITNGQVPVEYEDKKKYLLKNNIAIWDICKACIREGSLDSNISSETPNDIRTFIDEHPNIKTIAFNGKEAAKLFGKHIGNINGINLIVLPSTSPANAGVSWDVKVKEWNKLKPIINE